MKATYNSLRKLKLLKNGGLMCRDCVAHKNPHFSLEAVKGLVSFYRFSVIGKPFPDCLKPKYFLLRPMMRSEIIHK